jgi:hypothetical protein
MEQKPAPMRAHLLSRLLRPTAPPVALGIAIAPRDTIPARMALTTSSGIA